MKNFWTSVTLVLASFLPTLYAYGERGVAERMLYWLAYLAEEQVVSLDSTYSYTVAPGCVGKTRANGRCTLDELLMYIWAPDSAAKDTVAPTKVSPSTGIIDQGMSINYNQFFGKIQNAKFDGRVEVTGDVDSSKLMPGKSDYYSVLSAMGDPIEKLSQACMSAVAAAKSGGPAFKISSAQRKIWEWGKDSAFLVSALRRKDLDKYRVEWFKTYFEKNKPPGLADTFEPVMTNIDTALTTKAPTGKGTVAQSIPAIDFTGTIQKYQAEIPDIASRLKSGNTAYMSVTKNGQLFNAAHQKALDAAQSAVAGCKCTRSYPASLKKRRVMSPKAARSMKLKAGKLGLAA